MKKEKLVVYVTPEVRAALDKLHRESGASIAEVVRRMIGAALAKKEGAK